MSVSGASICIDQDDVAHAMQAHLARDRGVKMTRIQYTESCKHRALPH
jgi:hypothetical protein